MKPIPMLNERDVRENGNQWLLIAVLLFIAAEVFGAFALYTYLSDPSYSPSPNAFLVFLTIVLFAISVIYLGVALETKRKHSELRVAIEEQKIEQNDKILSALTQLNSNALVFFKSFDTIDPSTLDEPVAAPRSDKKGRFNLNDFINGA